METIKSKRLERKIETPKINSDTKKSETAFIEFGCSSKKPLQYASTITPGRGFGFSDSQEVVDFCAAQDLDVRLGSLLDYEEKNSASVTLAMNLMPELGARTDFEKGFTNLVQAARNFAVIQHSYYDNDGFLAASGWQVNGNYHKKTQYKPTVADYVSTVKRMRASLQICGLAMFGLGQADLIPLTVSEGLEPKSNYASAPTFRTVRVLVGRKDKARFRAGLQKVGSGTNIFLWEDS